MTAADFRRIALSLAGVEEVARAGLPAFRVARGGVANNKRGKRWFVGYTPICLVVADSPETVVGSLLPGTLLPVSLQDAGHVEQRGDIDVSMLAR